MRKPIQVNSGPVRCNSSLKAAAMNLAHSISQTKVTAADVMNAGLFAAILQPERIVEWIDALKVVNDFEDEEECASTLTRAGIPPHLAGLISGTIDGDEVLVAEEARKRWAADGASAIRVPMARYEADAIARDCDNTLNVLAKVRSLRNAVDQPFEVQLGSVRRWARGQLDAIEARLDADA